jgi:hypothetical protein
MGEGRGVPKPWVAVEGCPMPMTPWIAQRGDLTTADGGSGSPVTPRVVGEGGHLTPWIEIEGCHQT